MGSRDEDIAWILELLAPLGRITARRMFGGAGLYADGLIVGLEIGGALYLKTDEQTQTRFADAGCVPFVYEGQAKPITMRYWTVPDDAMDSPEAMRPWAALALAAARRSETVKAAKAAKKTTGTTRGSGRKPSR